MRVDAIRAHLIDRLLASATRAAPYDHALPRELFPQAFYRELVQLRPRTFLDGDASLHHQRGPGDGRRQLLLQDAALDALGGAAALAFRCVREVLNHTDVIATYRQLFAAALRSTWPHELHEPLLPTLSLAWERAGFALPPHSEAPNKRIQALYYLAEPSDDPRLGTAIYTPREPGLRCTGDRYHAREDFVLHATAPYEPNTGFVFVKSERSFHGVEEIHRPGAERWVLVHTLHRWL